MFRLHKEGDRDFRCSRTKWESLMENDMETGIYGFRLGACRGLGAVRRVSGSRASDSNVQSSMVLGFTKWGTGFRYQGFRVLSFRVLLIRCGVGFRIQGSRVLGFWLVQSGV